MANFRKLNANEIECRVATVKAPKVEGNKVSGGGCSILLYKDARVDMRLLDEVFGMMGWKREHQTIEGRLYCTISVYDKESGQWVSKQDVGVESYTEKEKGQASDSFKRACFNLGIGRELYTAPFIWISSTKCNITKKGDKLTTYDRFTVDEIGYDEDGTINRLVIRNMGSSFEKRNDIVFQFGDAVTEEQKAEQKYDKARSERITDTQAKSIRETIDKNPDKISEKGVCVYFGIPTIEDMTLMQLQEFLRLLNGKGKK